MRKIVLLAICAIFLTGCSAVENDSMESILKKGMSDSLSISNTNRTGYKYYSPKGIKNINTHDYNEVLYSDQYAYYLYVDVVSYFNKIKETYEESKNFYYSKKLVNNEIFGYLQIKSLGNDKYFVEIMYNYAKIEVIVAYNDIKKSVAYAMSILNSVTYNDTVLGSLVGNNTINSNELIYNIFETAKSESNYLEIGEEYENQKKNDVPDTDFIK